MIVVCNRANDVGVIIDVASWERDGPMAPARMRAMLQANNYHGILCTINDNMNKEMLSINQHLRVVSTYSVGCVLYCRVCDLTSNGTLVYIAFMVTNSATTISTSSFAKRPTSKSATRPMY